MKQLVALLAFGAMAVMACGGDDDNGGGGNGGGSGVVISAEDADRVAHAALPAIDDLGGDNWAIIGQDEFDSGSSDGFLEFIEGNPECESLENLTALEGVFGGGETEDAPIGQAQVEFESQDPDALIPASVEVEVEIDESAGGSRAEFDIVKNLFESDETANCLISVLNSQFAESGPAGLQIEVQKGSPAASAPQDGATMAFDMSMSFAGIELDLAMQLFFWPYGNASVQALFLGTSETLSGDFVGGVLDTVDGNLTTAANQ